MDVIGNLGDPAKDVAAVEPALERAITALVSQLKAALQETLDGLTITVTISRKTTEGQQ